MSGTESASPSPNSQGGTGIPGTPSTVTYAGSVEQTDEARAQAQVAQNPLSKGVVGAVFGQSLEAKAKSNAERAASQYAAAQVQSLGQDIATKAGPHTGGHNYLAYQQNELHQMV